jgi:two-component system, NarL family, sensor histidine kinase UhpB
VTFEQPDGRRNDIPPPPNDLKQPPPGWFVNIIHPARREDRIDAVVDGRRHGAFIVAADPEDEIAELWDSIADLAIDGSCAAILGFVILFFVVRSASAPLHSLSQALSSLSDGDYRARLTDDVPFEFRKLVAGFNGLGASLQAAQVENQTLRARLVSIQDEERRELARELHDEVGPHLFAARAHADAARRTASSGPDSPGDNIDAIVESIDAIQEINRGSCIGCGLPYSRNWDCQRRFRR